MPPEPTRLTRSERLAYGSAWLLALGVGVLLGRACQPEPPEPEPPAPARTVNICPCPPDEPEPPAAPRPRPVKKLPPAKPPGEHQARRRLLAWVREHASDLEPCRAGGNQVARIGVTLVVGENGAIEAVTLNTAPGEVPQRALSCVRDRIAAWTLPRALTTGKRELLFGLSL